MEEKKSCYSILCILHSAFCGASTDVLSLGQQSVNKHFTLLTCACGASTDMLSLGQQSINIYIYILFCSVPNTWMGFGWGGTGAGCGCGVRVRVAGAHNPRPS